MLDPRVAGVHLALPHRRMLKAFDRRRVATPHEAHAERPFWGPHPDKAIAKIEADFFRVGNDFLRQVYAAALGKPLPSPRSIMKAFHVDPGQLDGWGKLSDLFNSKLPAPKLLQGWDALLQKLTSTLLPEESIEAAAARLAIHSSLMWRLGQRVLNPPELEWDAAKKAISSQQAEAMSYAKAHGMAYLRGLSDETRKSLRLLLVDSKEAGEGAQGLQRRLFDKVSQLNMDWRRIALTETGMAVTNGQIASAPLGAKARWMASPMACKHCLAKQNQVFDVLHAPDPSKGDVAIWPGKNNVGRSAYRWSKKMGRWRTPSEMWWPCQPMHPLCCCTYVITPA